MKYNNYLIYRYVKDIGKKIKFNYKLQRLYDSYELFNDFCFKLEEFNMNLDMPYLSTGFSSYFNDIIEKDGIENARLLDQDKEDCKFIAKCFGKDINYSDNGLSIVYFNSLGTSELNYAMQSFPAGIYEDVFQCSVDHTFPIRPYVGEDEIDFYCRVLEYQISNYSDFPVHNHDEVLIRGRRLAERFCSGKNRIYVVPITNLLDNKASFGDVAGLRDGSLSGDALKDKMNSLYSFRELLKSYDINKESMYYNPNMTSEYGIAIYGNFSNENISYFEVDRFYDILQKNAINMGYKNGDVIPLEVSDVDRVTNVRDKRVKK